MKGCDEMDEYEKNYYFLFNKITDVIESLKEIQQTAEMIFIEKNCENCNIVYKAELNSELANEKL